MPNVTIQKMNCLRCGHSWAPRQTDVRICPKCKSPYWDRPRKETKKAAKSQITKQ
jgi:Zn finger protein HypA/HybF involved in hydrogenase expression